MFRCDLRSFSSAAWKNGPALLFCLLFAVALPARAQNSIDTVASWNGTTYISSFGVPNTATYGQTVSVPAGASPLNSFSFEIGNCSASVTFRGEVYAWDGTRASGSSLFESAPVTLAASSSFQLVTFNAGGITLPAGNYILFASTSQDQGGAPSSACRWGAVGNNTAYPGGQFCFLNNGTNAGAWTSQSWATIAMDLAFQVNGLVAPSSRPIGTPAASTTSLLVGLLGLSAMGLYYLYRQRHRQRA